MTCREKIERDVIPRIMETDIICSVTYSSSLRGSIGIALGGWVIDRTVLQIKPSTSEGGGAHGRLELEPDSYEIGRQVLLKLGAIILHQLVFW